MKTLVKIPAVIATATLTLLATSCSKADTSHLDTDPYSFYISNVSANASQSLGTGETVTFDVILQYIDDSAPEGWRGTKDDGAVALITATAGLEIVKFGEVKVREGASATETVTVTVPHGYKNGDDMKKVLSLSCK